jgi:hypothetical protein
VEFHGAFFFCLDHEPFRADKPMPVDRMPAERPPRGGERQPVGTACRSLEKRDFGHVSPGQPVRLAEVYGKITCTYGDRLETFEHLRVASVQVCCGASRDAIRSLKKSSRI